MKRHHCIIIALTACVLLSIVGEARAQSSSFTFDQWASETHYKAVKKVSASAYIVEFDEDSAKEHSGGWRVCIEYNNAKHDWVQVYATILHRGEGFSFPRAMVDWCLEYGSRYSGAKLVWDPRHGDIDAVWEIPTSLATVAIIDRAVNFVAACADDNHDKLMKMMSAP